MVWEVVLVSIMLMGIGWTAVMWDVDLRIKARANQERNDKNIIEN